jgi:hypothetical protein
VLTAQARLALPQDDNDMGIADGAAQGVLQKAVVELAKEGTMLGKKRKSQH